MTVVATGIINADDAKNYVVVITRQWSIFTWLGELVVTVSGIIPITTCKLWVNFEGKLTPLLVNISQPLYTNQL